MPVLPDHRSAIRENSKKDALDSVDEGKKDNEAELEQRRDRIREQVQDFARDLYAGSHKEAQEMLKGLDHIPLRAEEISGWEKVCTHKLSQHRHEARTLFFEQMMDPLERAFGEKLISRDVIDYMKNKFSDSNVNFIDKKAYFLTKLPAYIKLWRAAKQERDELLKDPRFKGLGSRHVKNLAAFMDEKTFVSMEYFEKKKLCNEVRGAMLAVDKGMEESMDDVRNELNGWVAEGILHHSKVGAWIGRIFSRCDTPQEADQFMKKTVRGMAERWADARVKFDELNSQMKAQGVPRGFNPVSSDEFLQWDYRQRTSYNGLLELRMDTTVETDKQLAGMKLRIRYRMDIGDLDGAQQTLNEALEIREDDTELLSMKEFIECRRNETAEANELSENPAEVQDEARTILALMPAEAMDMHGKAAQMGLGEEEALSRMFYNLVWVHEHNYSNEANDLKQEKSESNIDQTREYIKEGHSDDLERNVLRGDTAKKEGIRTGCTYAQMIYANRQGKAAVMEMLPQIKDNEQDLYWTSLKLEGLDFNLHNQMVKNLQWPFLQRLRKLDGMGYRFTLAGGLEPKGGEAAKASNKSPQSTETHYAVAP
jgi:hypothetical protein